METIQICWTEKPLSKYGLRWGVQYFLINMKLFLISFLLICTTHALFAQESLSSMPKGKRDSVLVEVTQKLLKDKFPKWYRKDVYPSITQSDFKYSFLKWLQKEWPKSHKSIPEYLKPEDLCYNVTLYYEKWRDEKFESPYTVSATIIEKNQEVYHVVLGGTNFGYRWQALKEMKREESLSSMTTKKRDSILVEISQNVLKEKYPELYRKDIYPTIEQGDFKLLNLDWTLIGQYEYAPSYVSPDDLYYAVTLYYEKWRDEKFEVPFTAMVYIIEKTQEPYKIRLGTKYCEYHSLIKLDEK